MKLNNIIFIVVALVSMVSCQKQLNWKIDPLTGLVAGDSSHLLTSTKKLHNILAVSGNETLITNFTYDASGNIITEHILGTTQGKEMNLFKRYYRDTLGRIERIAQLEYQPGFSTDTTFTNVYYDDPATNKFLHALHIKEIAGNISRDSAVYTFDGNEHMGLLKLYHSGTSHGTMVLNKRIEYSYANDNMVAQKMFADTSNTGKMALIETTTYTYDHRLNALQQRAEAHLTGRITAASKNNVTRMEVVKSNNNGNYSIVTSIVYNTYNMPLTATARFLPGEKFITNTFFYQ